MNKITVINTLKHYIMKSNLCSTLIILLICSSCNNNKTKISESATFPYLVDVEKSISDIKEIPLSSIGKRLEYIPLETNPECMLQAAYIIAMSESYIFVSDGRTIVEFDRNGRYLRKIGSQGRGPGQFTDDMDLCFNESQKKLFILDVKALLVYNFDGTFIESTKLPFLSIHFALKDYNNLIYYTANSPVSDTATLFSWYVSDLHGGNIKRYKNYHKRLNNGSNIADSPLLRFNNESRFMEFGSDTLMYFKDNKPSPYAIINLGEMKMEPDPVFTRERYRDILNSLAQKLWTRFIVEDKSRLYMTFYWGFSDSTRTCIYNKITNETLSSKNGLVNDIDMGLPFWPKYIYNDSILVDKTDALKLIKRIKEIKSSNNGSLKGELKTLEKNLTENSNPVLMVLR